MDENPTTTDQWTPIRVARTNFRHWLSELRSTPLEQTTGKLFATGENRHHMVAACCLGVGTCLVPTINPLLFLDRGLPPKEFIEWLGLPMEAPGVIANDQGENCDLLPDWPEDLKVFQSPADLRKRLPGDFEHEESIHGWLTASKLNDDWGLTFAQIADVFDYFGVAGVKFVPRYDL